ncbi:hypothetical protein RCF98_03465 [Thiothrix lacustris]|uniref:Tubulin/FtsZ 2-layer sandwich domain-containing protein n=1 Tax=Thiothrix lacustris TaxID=525917 RepID=A0ABY9MRZ4_9GAMM|nr:hypothetical protein [Thiothrix lacustris]WML91419.1 hypothetical protein RCF98_03465 [Thiothrix lacustris]
MFELSKSKSPTVAVFGLGNNGCRAVDDLQKHSMTGITYRYADTSEHIRGQLTGIHLAFILVDAEDYTNLNLSRLVSNMQDVMEISTIVLDTAQTNTNVLMNTVKFIADLIINPGLINLDSADVRTMMPTHNTLAVLGSGQAHGEDRAIKAAQAAIASTSAEANYLMSAGTCLISMEGNVDMTLHEFESIMNEVATFMRPDVNFMMATVFNPKAQDKCIVTILTTNFINPSETALGINKANLLFLLGA